MIANYLESIRKQFDYYKMLGDKTFAQLSEEDCLWTAHPDGNSVTIIVNHIWGNMMSRWTDFLSTDGEKEWRDRDGEFENRIKTKAEMIHKWEEGWNCLFTALESINEDNFDTVIYIRNMGHTVTEAINRQLAHYAYHIGQIVYIGNMRKGADWKSLSIPKGNSKQYNARKFSAPKRMEHFTNEFLNKDKE